MAKKAIATKKADLATAKETNKVDLLVDGQVYKSFDAKGMNISLKGISNFEKMKLSKEEEITLKCGENVVTTKELRQRVKALIFSLCIKYLPENQVTNDNGDTKDENLELREKLQKLVLDKYNVPYLQIHSLLKLSRKDFEKSASNSDNIRNEFKRQFGNDMNLLTNEK